MSSFVNLLAENELLQRLCFATLELAVLSLVLALVLRLARFASQRLVACLWLIVLAKPLVTLAFGAPIALFELHAPAFELAPITARVERDVAAPLAVTGYVETRTVPAPAPAGSTSAVPAGSATVGDAPESTPWPAFETLLLIAWAAGVVWCAARYVHVRVRLARLLRGSVPAPLRVQHLYAELVRELRLRRIPDMRVVDELDSPALVGLVRPVVVLPRPLVQTSAPQTTEWALRHELAHWRWLDPLAILVRDAASVCFFFHPSLWWAARRHAEAMELACDWESLRDPSDAAEYAEGLGGILLLLRDQRPERALASGLAMASHGRMVRRIRALLDGERALPLTPRGVAGVLLVAAAVFAFGCKVREGESSEGTAQAPASPAKPNPATVQAIRDGLGWLARHQSADGAWHAKEIAATYPCDDPFFAPKEAYTPRYDEGLTGLALLAFLGSGLSDGNDELVDASTGKRFRAHDVVERGVAWLTARQRPGGNFGNDRAFMYSEALAGMAVAETYALTRDAKLQDPAQRSMDFIAGAQRPNPSGSGVWGWRYASRQEIEKFASRPGTDEQIKKELYDADTSITSWCTMALRSGALAGLNVGAEHFEGALAYTTWVTERNGMVGYLNPKGAGATVTGPGDHFTYHPADMSALGMATRVHAGREIDGEFMRLAAQQLAKDLPVISKDKLSIDYYYWYAGTLALSQYDGPRAKDRTDRYWGTWHKAVTDALLELQDHGSNPCSAGGWVVPDRWSTGVGPIYTTALNVLTLEVCERNPFTTRVK